MRDLIQGVTTEKEGLCITAPSYVEILLKNVIIVFINLKYQTRIGDIRWLNFYERENEPVHD